MQNIVTQKFAIITLKICIMIEFSCLVGVSLIETPEKWEIFMADPFTFEPTMTEENGGVYWDCSKTFVVDLPDNDTINVLRTPRNAIVTISDVSHISATENPVEYKIGTEGIPARVQLIKHLNKAKLVVKCKMLTNPLS